MMKKLDDLLAKNAVTVRAHFEVAERHRLADVHEQVLRRSGRRRVRNVALRAVAVVGMIAVAAVTVPLIRSTEIADDRGSRIAPADQGTWQPRATWERIPDAPIDGRYGNVAVWTGEEMLVWGGTDDDEDDHAELANGGAFDLRTGEWRRLSNSPLGASGGRSAVWTGDVMILWGGGSHTRPDNGAAYDPGTDTWTELPPAPYGNPVSHSAIWTGKEMIVWGGVRAEENGAAFDPRSGTWRKIASAPVDGRSGHSGVWTGTEMIVWGGRERLPLATGAAYAPDSDSWRELPPAPISGRDLHAATWTGEEMIVWGGWTEEAAVSDGAAYDPATNTWRELPRAPIEAAILDSSAVWTGREVIVAGADGKVAAYSPMENEWRTLPDPPMGAVSMPTLLGADGEVILWGGVPSSGEVDSNEGAILRLLSQ